MEKPRPGARSPFWSGLDLEREKLRAEQLSLHLAAAKAAELEEILNTMPRGLDYEFLGSGPDKRWVCCALTDQKIGVFDQLSRSRCALSPASNLSPSMASRTAELIARHHVIAFSDGTLNVRFTFPIIKLAILAKLTPGFSAPGSQLPQGPFDVVQTDIKDTVAITDRRPIAGRHWKHLAHPQYRFRYGSLLAEPNLVQYIDSFSVTYDRICGQLKQAIPMDTDTGVIHPSLSPDDMQRFHVTMCNANYWCISDNFRSRSYFLKHLDALDKSFLIGRWFQLASNIKHYHTEDLGSSHCCFLKPVLWLSRIFADLSKLLRSR